MFMHILNTMEYMKECSMIGCRFSLQNGHWYVSAPIFQQITVNAPAQRWIWTLCLHIWIYQYSSSTFSNFSKVTHRSWVIRSDSLSSLLKVFDAVEVKTFWRPVRFSATSNLGIFSLSRRQWAWICDDVKREKDVPETVTTTLKTELCCIYSYCVLWGNENSGFISYIYSQLSELRQKYNFRKKYCIVWYDQNSLKVVCNLPDLITFLIKCSHFNFNWYQKKNDISFVQLIPATSEKSNYTNTKNQIIIIW